MSKQLKAEPKEMEERYGRDVLAEVAEHLDYWYASAFTRPFWPVIIAEEPDRIQLMQWCMVPRWAKEPKEYATKTYNARSEDVLTSKTYKAPWQNGQRCLIPVTGFYEHRTEGKMKYPYFVHVPESRIFSLGGIYDKDTRTFSILTTRANELMAKVHNEAKRQPVIIPPPIESAWLNQNLSPEEAKQLCEPVSSERMEAFTISKRLTSKGERNCAEVMAPCEYPELAILDTL